MSIRKYKIVPEPNEIDDHLLDIIGNEFRFDHEKGISEWLKNSVDAYIRSELPDNQRQVIIRFSDSGSEKSSIECIDFVGMDLNDINKAFKRWGDPEAAKRGLRRRTYGGHGNGGKFYMRQMFEESYFTTYKDGKLNIFGFNENKKYGFAEGFKDKTTSIDEALEIAKINNIQIPNDTLNKLKANKIGFTVVKGGVPWGMPNTIKAYQICEKLKNYPQARRILERIKVTVIYNNKVIFDRLLPDQLKPYTGFEEPVVIEIPEKVIYWEGGKEKSIELTNKRYGGGKLELRTSEIALDRAGRFGELNRIDILGELGVIASYKVHELGMKIPHPQTVFIYGDCTCPILEDPDDDCVSNDRSKLIAENPKTKGLLNWIGEQIQLLAEKIMEKERKEQEEQGKQLSSAFNEFLDNWKNRFLDKLYSEIFVGPGQGPGAGIGLGGSSGGSLLGTNGHKGKSNLGQGDDEGGGNNPKKAKRFPKVLLSNHDDDPLSPGNTLNLSPRQGLVYQRPEDTDEGIYWINTTSPLASAILTKYGEQSPRWRDYLFQRYVDIFVKDALAKFEQKEPERFTAASIDSEILSKVVAMVHEAAAKDLDGFLFEERYETVNKAQ